MKLINEIICCFPEKTSLAFTEYVLLFGSAEKGILLSQVSCLSKSFG